MLLNEAFSTQKVSFEPCSSFIKCKRYAHFSHIQGIQHILLHANLKCKTLPTIPECTSKILTPIIKATPTLLTVLRRLFPLGRLAFDCAVRKKTNAEELQESTAERFTNQHI